MEKLKTYLFELIKSKDWKTLKQELNKVDPTQIAEMIESFGKTNGTIIFRILPRDLSKKTFQHLFHEQQKYIIEKLITNTAKLTNLLNDLDPDDRTAFFEELPGEISWKLVQLLSLKERTIATSLLGYPEKSIGRLMTPKYITIELNSTVQDALNHIRHSWKNSETIDVVYIIDTKRHLVNDIQLKKLILESPNEIIANLTDNNFVSLSAYDDQETAVQIFQDYDRVVLPVVDTNNVLLGIVTIDDVMDIAEEENTEDFQKFGGIKELNLPYTKAPLIQLIKKRAGWLVVLFISEMFTTSALSIFEKRITSIFIFTMFLPLIISSGGNSGSQAASLIIRSLAIEELDSKNWWYVMKKEIISGLLLGIILGSVGFIRIFLWQKIGIYNYGYSWWLAGFSIALSLTFVVLWGTISGSMIPLILKRFGLDPATASAPMVATLVDVSGVVIYCLVSILIFGDPSHQCTCTLK